MTTNSDSMDARLHREREIMTQIWHSPFLQSPMRGQRKEAINGITTMRIGA
jgi:hypothetical protein